MAVAINKLAQETAGKIAAGEVVERPVNVVKELVENSLDAGAERIDIQVENGGKHMIRIEDNGEGILNDDLPMAVENYSTSKISSTSDLSNIVTLGFRGEALASIKSVSRLTISSKSAEEDVGREMRWRGEKLESDGPAVMNNGTSVVVEDLFFNFPARRKFLSSDSSELRRITALIQNFSLAYPKISFSLGSGNREVLSYPSSSFDERVEMVLGSSVFSNLRPISKSYGGMTVHGFTSLPGITKRNRSSQFLFVNMRPVKDRVLNHAVNQAYRSVIASDRFPIVVLLLKLDPGKVDVNVHPTKAEVRFETEREIHRLVSSTIRDELQGNTISFREKVESVYKTIFPASRESKDEYRDSPDESERVRTDWLFQEAPEQLFESGEDTVSPTVSSGLYWQLHGSYIIIQIRGAMVIIDQHAAHERILYNQAMANVEGLQPAVQSLLFPATIELSPDEFDQFESITDILPKLGFEAEPFGLRSIIVRGIPAGVRNWNDGRLLKEILSDIDGKRNAVDHIVKSYACKSAIKAGEPLTPKEMESLTDQLFATEFPFTCPHGRPTMLRVDMRELERRFHRTPRTDK
jgi:DNA mismatch repair protein MutL